MNALLVWLAETWPHIPKVLRSLLLLIIASGAIGVGIGVGVLAWKSGYVESRLGVLATSQDVQDQTDVITDKVDDTNERMKSIVHSSLQQYTDSLTLVRADVEEHMAKPILQNIITLKAQVAAIMKAQNITCDAIEQQRRTNEETTRELLNRIEARPSDQTTQVLQQIQQQLIDLQDKVADRNRPIKKEF
jgi:Zn-dependent oligopeptidase